MDKTLYILCYNIVLTIILLIGQLMLKKLVKYGNSNAIILDKAILELLDIEEGSIIKIRTDGKSIIITPHVQVAPEKINETFTHNQATTETAVKESFKKYKGIDKNEREELEKEFANLITRHQDLCSKLYQNPKYLEKITQIAKTLDTSCPEYLEAYKAVRYQCSPELARVEKKLITFENKNKLSVQENLEPIETMSDDEQKTMEQEFFLVHKKNSAIYKAYGELLNNPEYQHQAQLLAEKYNADKNSADYMREIDELTDKYLPEFRHAKEELKAIAQRHANKTASVSK
jgi:antitoxin component of MazEF toxin-antitoxin module